VSVVHCESADEAAHIRGLSARGSSRSTPARRSEMHRSNGSMASLLPVYSRTPLSCSRLQPERRLSPFIADLPSLPLLAPPPLFHLQRARVPRSVPQARRPDAALQGQHPRRGRVRPAHVGQARRLLGRRLRPQHAQHEAVRACMTWQAALPACVGRHGRQPHKRALGDERRSLHRLNKRAGRAVQLRRTDVVTRTSSLWRRRHALLDLRTI